ncbi:MAG TPA: phosphopyruvate hydratase [Candidatus Thermoplasmatota archaeon]|nr:phosphopyruvate hydratase [Candidatus Thermoplasmatota archaeon]
MGAIEQVFFRKILDSRGNATVEVEVFDEDGSIGRAAAPSGASTGAHEVAAWAKGGVDDSLAVARAELLEEISGVDVLLQREIDEAIVTLDGTDDLSRIGGNLAVATSLAVARCAAASLGIPLYAYLGGTFVSRLPRPFGNVLGGGAHAVGGTDIQEYMAVALGPTVVESVFANAKVHKLVKDELKKRYPGISLGKGDEGAWNAPIGNVEALELVAGVCDVVGDEAGFEIRPALDVAATELWDGKVYNYKDGKRTSADQVEFLADLASRFGLLSIEDGLAEDDWDGWIALTKRIGDKVLIVGDDLFTTNPERVRSGIERRAGNAVLIKPNQIGTLSRTVETIQLAHENGFKTVISHRSGETTDDAIAHIGAAFGCFGIKTGAVGGERIAKLNELIRIEEEL